MIYKQVSQNNISLEFHLRRLYIIVTETGIYILRDFHTHIAGERGYPFIFSGMKPDEAQIVSFQQHPWYLPDVFEFDAGKFAGILQNFAALGEVGLDKVHGAPVDVQEKFLDAMLQVAAELDKPVIFHCVKFLPEVMAKVRYYRLRRVLYHGFRGSPAVLDMLWRAGWMVSFHKDICRNGRLLEALKNPGGDFGFESDDDAACDLPEVVTLAMRNSGNMDLEKAADTAFEEFING